MTHEIHCSAELLGEGISNINRACGSFHLLVAPHETASCDKRPLPFVCVVEVKRSTLAAMHLNQDWMPVGVAISSSIPAPYSILDLR